MVADQRDTLQVHLILRGEFDPDRISTILGRRPDKEWRRGDPVSGSTRLRSEDVWLANGRLSTPLGDQLSELLVVLEGGSKQLPPSLSREFVVALSQTAGTGPEMVIEPDILRRIAESDAVLAFDTFFEGPA